MMVRTPSGNRVPLNEAYDKWGGTHINVNDVPGLTDYLIAQPQAEAATAREIEKEQADKHVRHLWPYIAPDGKEKRLYDVIMRNTAGEANPLYPLIFDAVPDLLTHPAKTYRTLDYILGNNQQPTNVNRPSINSMNPEDAYNGFWTPNSIIGIQNNMQGEPVSSGNDIISAYLGLGDMRSDLGTKYSGAEKDSLIAANTPFSNYIARNYPEKDIQLYKLSLHRDTKTVPDNIESSITWGPWSGVEETMDNYDDLRMPNGWVPNLGGHQKRTGVLPDGSKVIQQSDIWKFNPDDYSKKWGVSFIKPFIGRLDAVSYPVITYTPPYYSK